MLSNLLGGAAGHRAVVLSYPTRLLSAAVAAILSDQFELQKEGVCALRNALNHSTEGDEWTAQLVSTLFHSREEEARLLVLHIVGLLKGGALDVEAAIHCVLVLHVAAVTSAAAANLCVETGTADVLEDLQVSRISRE